MKKQFNLAKVSQLKRNKLKQEINTENKKNIVGFCERTLIYVFQFLAWKYFFSIL